MNGVQRFVRWLRGGERGGDDYEYVPNPVSFRSSFLVDTSGCRAGEALYMNGDGTVTSLPRCGHCGRVTGDETLFRISDALRVGDCCYALTDAELNIMAGDTMTFPSGTTYTAIEDYAGDVTFEPDD